MNTATVLNRDAIVAKRREVLAGFGISEPSGTTPQDLLRDLKAGKRIAVERGFQTLNRAKGDPNDRLIEFVCSTEGPKRDGNVVRAAGFKFNNFDRNPVAPWGHDYSQLPCGRWVEREVARVNGVPSLCMTAQFATTTENEFAEKVYRCYLGGFLNAVSIGWEPLKYRELRGPKGEWLGGIEFLESDLLECSFVLVPADPDAIPRAVRTGIFNADEAASFARWAEIDRGAAYVLSHREDESATTATFAAAQARSTAGAEAVPAGGAAPAAAPAQRASEKECPDCGASCASDAESCARCGYDFQAGKKVDSSDSETAGSCADDEEKKKAAAPRPQMRRLTRKAKKRSELTDALDAEYDEVRGLAYRLWEHVERLGFDIDSMFYADKPTAEPYEATWAMECRSYIDRTRKRLASLAVSIDESLGRMGDATSAIPLAATEGGDAGAGPVMSAAGDVGGQRAGKKQFSRSRLERLLAVEAGIAESRDLTEKHRALLREVLDEAVAEQREREKAGDKEDTPDGEGDDSKELVDDEEEKRALQASADDPLVQELAAIARGDAPAGDAGAAPEQRANDDATAAEQLTRAEDDELMAELMGMVREGQVARTADEILAGLPGRK